MARSLIQMVNDGPQTVDAGGLISLGTIQRRFGPSINGAGANVVINGPGYFTIDAAVTVEPTAPGAVSVGVQRNGTLIPGAVGTATVAVAEDAATVPIVSTTRIKFPSDGADTLSLALISGAGSVTNVSFRVVKL